MRGIATCQDCPINITIYRFTGSQGFFSIPKKWCEECDLLVELVKKTVSSLRLENKTKLTIKPWFPWFWQPLLTNLAWHAPILTINGRLISQGIVPDKHIFTKALLENVVQTTEI
ncbi:hypothetical protein HYS96_02675 [Candidatus Daviesbacteria bacterium]|nr:hypothetical protein [Candidatus Daviesbacteria bacterium]